jgi:hypothetical protein
MSAEPDISAPAARVSGSRSGPGAALRSFVGLAAQKALPAAPAGIVLNDRCFVAEPELSIAADPGIASPAASDCGIPAGNCFR